MRYRYDLNPFFFIATGPPKKLLRLTTIQSLAAADYVVPTQKFPAGHHQVASQGLHPLLSKPLRIHSRFTPLTQKPSSSHKHSQATPTKICSDCPSTCAHTHPSTEQSRPLTQPRRRNLTGLANKSLPFHFLQSKIRSVRCNTFLSGCRPPWPPSDCPNHATGFTIFRLDSLARLEVHSSSHPMLTTGCPLTRTMRASSEFILRKGWCFTRPHLLTSRCPKRHFRGNQLPDSSFGLSPLRPSHAIELHVRTAQDLQCTFVHLHPTQA